MAKNGQKSHFFLYRFGHFWPFFGIFPKNAHFWPFLAIFGHFLAIFGHFWPFFGHFLAIFWPFLASNSLSCGGISSCRFLHFFCHCSEVVPRKTTQSPGKRSAEEAPKMTVCSRMGTLYKQTAAHHRHVPAGGEKARQINCRKWPRRAS